VRVIDRQQQDCVTGGHEEVRCGVENIPSLAAMMTLSCSIVVFLNITVDVSKQAISHNGWMVGILQHF